MSGAANKFRNSVVTCHYFFQFFISNIMYKMSLSYRWGPKETYTERRIRNRRTVIVVVRNANSAEISDCI